MTSEPDSPNKPRVGITLGDPAGIGPEIVLKAVADARLRSACQLIIIADAVELRRQAQLLKLPCDYPLVREAEMTAMAGAEVVICDVGRRCAGVAFGKLSAAAGRAAIAFIETGVRLCLAQHLDAIATAPINKEALKLAGSPFPGHTEMLTAWCGAAQSLMCFFAGNLRVVLLTIHQSLQDAIRSIRKERVIAAIALTDQEMRRFGISQPRIAVAGVNPHAGEHGLFGREELDEIEPAIAYCRTQLQIDVSGAFPADTIFVRAARGEFDTVIAGYHDQGLIAVKCLAFGEAVNVTLGLPIIRTSVDHGTAFDKAGQGIAQAQSLIEAIKLAAQLARYRQ
ncbi:MAG: 4-hydroxythreonine-4-phosphate dehydrogenase PdxA [Acidobacteria bacterium]|nr:4-hydroxythreonine-4-phosphate dehydrogenase PdxA [Acidobacteriota bacterium]